MSVGQRIQERLNLIGMSQAELARRVSMSQGAMNNLIAGRSRSSTLLHAIARELKTTPAYLAGETNDPQSDTPTPPPAPVPALVTMQVALPTNSALAAMFRGLLRGIDLGLPRADIAQRLADTLPIGLAQLEDLLPEHLGKRHLADRTSVEASDPKHHPVEP